MPENASDNRTFTDKLASRKFAAMVLGIVWNGWMVYAKEMTGKEVTPYVVGLLVAYILGQAFADTGLFKGMNNSQLAGIISAITGVTINGNSKTPEAPVAPQPPQPPADINEGKV